jgi:hypothetical protein
MHSTLLVDACGLLCWGVCALAGCCGRKGRARARARGQRAGGAWGSGRGRRSKGLKGATRAGGNREEAARVGCPHAMPRARDFVCPRTFCRFAGRTGPCCGGWLAHREKSSPTGHQQSMRAPHTTQDYSRAQRSYAIGHGMSSAHSGTHRLLPLPFPLGCRGRWALLRLLPLMPCAHALLFPLTTAHSP